MRTLLLTIVLLGCNDPAPDTELRANFFGSWTNSSGNVTVMCPGKPDDTGMLTPEELKLTIGMGLTPPLVIISFAEPADCAVSATVNGNVATIDADKECTLNGGTLTVKKGGTFTTSDGVTMSGSFSHVLSGGGMTCTQVNTVQFKH
jgi:hypothetical protein